MKFNYTVLSTQNNHYLYDGVSGNIFSIENSIFLNHEKLFNRIYDGTHNTDKEFLNEYENILEAIKNNLLLLPSANHLRYWFDVSEYKKNYLNEIKHLMVGVTEKCNLRCKYCVYSGHYKNERTHSEIDIDNETLVKSIDYFLSLSGSSKKIINFYGGEPFINFESINKIVEYIKTIDDEIQIYITTNGVLLNKEIAEWFFKNKNVNLFVTLAGIPERHDELRVLNNKEPSFNIIRKNIMYIKEHDISSFSKRINYIFNIFDEVQLFELQNFFEEDEMFQNMASLPEISFIDCSDDDGYVRDIGRNIRNQYKEEITPLQKYVQLIEEKNLNNLIVKHYDNKFLHIHKRLTNSSDSIISGVCRPFVHKMFVDVYGNVNLCENFSYGNNFGTINDRFHIDSVDLLLTSYKNEREKTCTSCWASRICSLCFRDIFDRNGTINTERADLLCCNERAVMLQTMTEYCTVLENSPSLLSHLDDYIVYA